MSTTSKSTSFFIGLSSNATDDPSIEIEVSGGTGSEYSLSIAGKIDVCGRGRTRGTTATMHSEY